MKRRTPSAVPEHFATFDLDRWADPADEPGFDRYEAALHRWVAARDAWADEHGYAADDAWYAADHAALVAMPDAPWNADAI